MKLYLVGWLMQHHLPGWLAPDYAFMTALAALAASVLVLRLARRDGERTDLHARALLIAYVAALLGGYVFEGFRALPAAWAVRAVWPVFTAGRAAYGGLVAGVLAPAIYLRHKRLSPLAFLDRATLAMGTLFVFVRVGCFLEGCDFGTPTASALGVRFPAGSPAADAHASLGWVQWGQPSLPVHPTELYEAALGALASLAALVQLRRGRRDGAAFVTWIATYAAGRFVIELLRGDVDRGVYGGASTAQIVSLALLVACAFARLRGRDAVRAAVLAGGALLLADCAGDASPPLGELALRDALSAMPEAIAALPEDERQALARRFEDARQSSPAPEAQAVAHADPSEELSAIDGARKERGSDAMPFVALAREGSVVHAAWSAPDGGEDDEASPAPLVLEGAPATVTRDAELRALDGAAGRVVRATMRASSARRVVRVVGWPAAIAVAGGTAFVNASWLVTMAPSPQIVPSTLPPLAPVVRPFLTLTGGSLDVCVNSAYQQCLACFALDAGIDAGDACPGTPVLSDEATVAAECQVLAQVPPGTADPLVHFEELCALYFVESPSVAACVASRDGCQLASVPLTSANLASAVAFVASSTCVGQLDACIPGGGGSSGGSSGRRLRAADEQRRRGMWRMRQLQQLLFVRWRTGMQARDGLVQQVLHRRDVRAVRGEVRTEPAVALGAPLGRAARLSPAAVARAIAHPRSSMSSRRRWARAFSRPLSRH